MRRWPRVLLVLVLVLVGLVGMLPRRAVAQGEVFEPMRTGGTPFGEGQPVPGAEGLATMSLPSPAGTASPPTVVTFDGGAYIPQQTVGTTLVAKVVTGTLTFRVLGNVVVEPPARGVLIVVADPQVHGQLPPDRVPEGEITFLRPQQAITPADCLGGADVAGAGKALCEVNPEVLRQKAPGAPEGNYFIVLEPGTTIVIPPNTQCFFCNVTGSHADGANGTRDESRAQVIFWAAPAVPPFDFNAFLKGPPLNPTPGTPSAAGPGGVRAMLLRPGSPCH